MFTYKSFIFAIDCLFALAGIALATPFALILAAPFLGG